MIIKYTISLLVTLIFAAFFFSCAGDEYGNGEQDIVLLKDTVIIKVDSVVKEKRNLTRLNLNLVIQLGAFKMRNNAEKFASTAHDKLNAKIDIRQNDNVYVVTVGSFTEGSKAEDFLVFVKARGYDSAFIKNLE